MSMKKSLFLLVCLAPIHLLAADMPVFDPADQVIKRSEWGAIAADENCESIANYGHKYPVRFIFDIIPSQADTVITLQALQNIHMDKGGEHKLSDIAYNCCFDQDGD